MEAMQSGRERFKITPAVRREIVKIVDERMREAHVTREDFSELKGIVAELAQAQRDLAEAQKRTEARLDGLTVKVEELTEAQKRTEEVRTLAVGLKRTREDLGGLSRSFSYAFENEAYRMLPKLLEEKYGIRVKEKIIRTDIGNQEVNFLARAEKEGREVYLVGEAKLRLDDGKKRKDVWKELEEKVKAVKEEYGEVEVVPFLVTHFATKGFLRQAKERGIIVVQSFEW
ncbi:hypothetical protein [Atrimonas thermophila]|uniref:hypothetical protein n=1 Tax=Atrimonas thermophila TaxID=3064161 RepID=UPI00399C96CD